MVNALYDTGRNAFLSGDIDWLVDDIRVQLVDVSPSGTYVPDLAAHDFLADIPVADRVGPATALGGRTAVAGVADAADTTLLTVTGDQAEALVIYKHTGSDATAQLIAYIDTATGLPVLPNGGNITIAWDNGANRIFKL